MDNLATPLAATTAPVAQLFGVKNLSDKNLFACEPWTYPTALPPEAAISKDEFRLWQSRPTTDHLFFTATEPLSAVQRPSKENYCSKLHGLIVDYDAAITDGMIDSLRTRCAPGLEPTWVCRTFSGGVRLIFLFERPIAMEKPLLAAKFLEVAKREMGLTKILPGLDEAAWKDLHRLYAVGKDWKRLADYAIPTNRLGYWLFDASAKVNARKLADLVIPLEAVYAEVERQYPGRWSGDFEVGSRGRVFFNPESTNDSAAIVTETGMICFSTPDKLFHDWEEILGTPFVKRYREDRIGNAASNVHFDGKFYYIKDDDTGFWNSLAKEDFGLQLRVQHGIDPTKRNGEVASELDRVLVYVQKQRRVDAVAPRIYSKKDVFIENGRTYLNTARVQAMSPATAPQVWGENFPWLADFLDTCWAKPVTIQRDYFFAWLQRFYVSALHGDLRQGHALFLAGPIGRGKTLMMHVLELAMGGAALASAYLSGDTSFNKELLETGLWTIDDGVASQDPIIHQRSSELIKQVVANSGFNYHPKGRDALKVTWNGRVVVALNDSDAGIRSIPALEPTIEDKLMIFRFSDAVRQFPDKAELAATIALELPSFLRWLVDWEVPEAIKGESRFGCKNFIHPELRVMATNAGGLSEVLQVLDVWIKRCNPVDSYGEVWTGTAADLLVMWGTGGVSRSRP